jgi:hypothetical protein
MSVSCFYLGKRAQQSSGSRRSTPPALLPQNSRISARRKRRDRHRSIEPEYILSINGNAQTRSNGILDHLDQAISQRAMDGKAQPALTELERQRAERIAQNQARLQALELPQLAASIVEEQNKAAEQAAAKRKRAKEAKLGVHPGSVKRRSNRAAAAAATARLADAAAASSGARGSLV